MEVTKMSNNNSPDMNKQEDQEVMLPGFRFHPTDEELVGFYLRRKVEKKPISIDIIKHVDIYKYDPWDLPRVSTVGDKEWYFFCIRGRKYRNSIRPNRVTGSGFWKATGIDKPIHSVNKEPHGHECLGLKKSLVYYRGCAGKGTKTDWMMHEFRLPPNGKSTNLSSNVKDIAQEAEVWTLCRIFKRTPSYKKYTPNWKDSITNVAANAIKHNPTDSSSKTCSSSLESETSCEQQQYMHQFQEQNETKPFINERNHLFMTQSQSQSLSLSQSQSQSPYSASFSRFWNPNSDDFFTNGNWDELRSVVELAIDPSHVYDYI